MMDHPNIAKVLDAGMTESGRPFFVMELVKGRPDHRILRRESSTAEERLELFVPVCQAIQHAHQKGIIHRDIKPSNVLVTLDDGKPVPKVIDFGVAKAIEQRLTEKTLFTAFGDMVGTPEYMSPEQARDQRAGYRHPQRHLLAGRSALRAIDRHDAAGKERLRGGGLHGDAAADPRGGAAEPSTRLHVRSESSASVAATRHRAGQAGEACARDLDWIVMKAPRRTALAATSPAATGRDIERHLDGDPVEAGPPRRSTA